MKGVGSGKKKAPAVSGAAPTIPLSQAIRYLDAEFRERLSREDPVRLFKLLRTLEIAVRLRMTEQILEVGYTKVGLQKMYRIAGDFLLDGKGEANKRLEAGREFFIEHTKAEWSVMFARDKLMLMDIGFIAAKDGDLRKARLLKSPEQVLALLRWTQFRSKPELLEHVITSVIKRGGPYAPKFFRRLADALKKPAVNFREHIPARIDNAHRRLQMFLLDHWATERMLSPGSAGEEPEVRREPGYATSWGTMPALYAFKNKALIDYLQALATRAQELTLPCDCAAVLDLDEKSLGMVWRRLGLHRPGTGYFADVEVDRTRRPPQRFERIVIWDRKPRRGF